MNDYSSTINLPKTAFPMKADLSRREPDFLRKWESLDMYEKILSRHINDTPFILHDGPPYANGNIHIGTALNKILKDAVVKIAALQGRYTPFTPGWDCHGMPIEHKVFQQMKSDKGKVDILAFRKQAKAYAEKFMAIQREEFKRLGIVGDWKNPYLTLHPSYEKVIIETFGKLYQDGFIVQGVKPIYWCWKCRTALAEAEVEYWDETSPSILVKFPVRKEFWSRLGSEEEVSFLIWTTTPWTLPANVAIAVHPDLSYILARSSKGWMVLAESLCGSIAEKTGISFSIEKRFTGKDLEGIVCHHPFIDRDSSVVLAEYVSDSDGSGCVHTAPGHGEEDYLTGLKYGLPVLSPVDDRGRFTDEVSAWQGTQVFEADPLIVETLEKQNLLLSSEEYSHSYPHCWRCKKPVIFRATKQWFFSVSHHNLRSLLKKSIEETVWFPAEGKNRIGSMVETRPDWCISRQRLWGVAIPVFFCIECGDPLCTPETIANVADLVGRYGSDIWFEKSANELLPEGTRCKKCGGSEFTKEEDILDVWFDSGVSHLAVLQEYERLSWPADLYLEGSDQHRGWFQSSLITSCAVKGAAPYRTVVTHGFVVDAEGRKMSKSLGNTVTPEEVIGQYGADILRLWALSENFQQDMRISKTIVAHLVVVYRTIRNTFRFLLGNLGDYDPLSGPEDPCTEVDRWARERLKKLVDDVTALNKEYAFHKGVQEIFSFCNIELSSFYLDYLKDILYTSKTDSLSRRSAQKVMYEILSSLLVLLAPVLSFTCEEAYGYLAGRKYESVFLEDWPLGGSNDTLLLSRWDRFFEFRKSVMKKIEEHRAAGSIGSSLETKIIVSADKEEKDFLESFQPYLAALLIVSEVSLTEGSSLHIAVEKSPYEKCQRCWMYHASVGSHSIHPNLCEKCLSVVEKIS
jgi:isoleucyl-tRNA synthetase